jgi:hypothetical protein
MLDGPTGVLGPMVLPEGKGGSNAFEYSSGVMGFLKLPQLGIGENGYG